MEWVPGKYIQEKKMITASHTYCSEAKWKWKLLSQVQLFGPHGLYSLWSFYRQIFFQLSHKGSSGTLEGVAYPFSRSSSWPRNQTSLLYCRQILYQLSPSQVRAQVRGLRIDPSIWTNWSTWINGGYNGNFKKRDVWKKQVKSINYFMKLLKYYSCEFII